MKQIPNIISLARIVSAPIMIALALHGDRNTFTWVLVAALISDILDGLLARVLHAQSELGSRLDSAGDAGMFASAVVGLGVFESAFISDNVWPVATVVALFFGEMILALIRYRRISSFHTYLSRIAAYAMGMFVGCLFVFGEQTILFFAASAVASTAYIEEIILVFLLPTWRANVRGLYWVLKEKL